MALQSQYFLNWNTTKKTVSCTILISTKVASKQGTSEVLDNIYLAVLAVMNVSSILHFKTNKQTKKKSKNKQKAPNT